MSDENLDYAAIRKNVEEGVKREKWIYRTVFFATDLLFFVVAMVVMWGAALSDSQLRAALFESGTLLPLAVIVPTILWALAVLFHAAQLYTESGAAEKEIRQRLLIREVGEDLLRRGLTDEAEKIKRHAEDLEAQEMRLSDDGELVPADEAPLIAQGDDEVRTDHRSSKI